MHKSGRPEALRLRIVFFLALALAVINSNSFMRMIAGCNTESVAAAADSLHGGKSSEFEVSEIFGYEFIHRAIKNAQWNNSDKSNEVSVCVVGEVNLPGQYGVGEPRTLYRALLLAGGPTQNGSMRKIKVLKEDNVCYEFDLYEVFFQNNKDVSPVLEGGETIVVESAGVRVRVDGRVVCPGVYELKSSERSLIWGLRFAGGPKQENQKKRIEVFRKIGNKKRHVLSELLNEENSAKVLTEFPVTDGDLIEVVTNEGFEETEVELSGHFRHPGPVILRSESRISDLVRKEHLLVGYAENYAELLRKDESKKKLRVISFSPKEVMSGDAQADFVLQNGDRLVIFSRAEIAEAAKVAVEGHVKKGGIFAWKKGQRVTELLRLTKGIKANSARFAELHRKQIGNGKLDTKIIVIDLPKAIKNDMRHNILLKPFDILVVKEEAKK